MTASVVRLLFETPIVLVPRCVVLLALTFQEPGAIPEKVVSPLRATPARQDS